MIRSSTFFAAVLLVGGFVYYVLGEEGVLPYRLNGQENMIIKIDDVSLRVEIADTPELRRRGLSGRDRLSPNAGMLFINDGQNDLNIWMKDMKFAIDILWLAKDGTIVDIKSDTRPESYPAVFRPSHPASYVLEVVAGFTEIHDITVGDHVDLNGVTDAS